MERYNELVSLTLACSRHEGVRNFYCGRTKRDCRRLAREDGWRFSHTKEASCPKCNGDISKQKSNRQSSGATAYHIVVRGDYLHIVCPACGLTCALDFKGFDPSVPLLEITCSCGSSGNLKIEGI